METISLDEEVTLPSSRPKERKVQCQRCFHLSTYGHTRGVIDTIEPESFYTLIESELKGRSLLLSLSLYFDQPLSFSL